MRRVRSIAGDSVPVLLYREIGRCDDTAEAALWALNEGLADYGPVLPSGVLVTLPELEEEAATAAAVSPWD
ncbi:tail protein X [Pseudomonas luteola]|uniref:tail protein X n=1 Tax=Pseudomonas luteola TaxID=47886 RepID=UPI0015E47DCF|nr:tail protein X [Pseudomonas zeshuii]MBA1250906.1 phage tail protein [Pseudomonas zeshuii]